MRNMTGRLQTRCTDEQYRSLLIAAAPQIAAFDGEVSTCFDGMF